MLKKNNLRKTNEKLIKEKQMKSKGITLISLVITIIVLLILAGVTIATLTGENGVLRKASEAKEKTEEAKEIELKKLAQMEAATHLEEYNYKDKNGAEINIPPQCSVSQIEGENTLEDGLVIIDVNGNEWVWIEVPRILDIYQNAGVDLDVNNINEEQCDIIYSDLANYVSRYRDASNKGEPVGKDEWYDGCGLDSNQYVQLKQKMLKSIYKNEGFFIGRYETGIKEEINRNYGTDFLTEHPINETPVIQKNKYVYNWVTCSQAQKLSESLSIETKTSSLMFGIQWDLVLKYIESKGEYTKDGTSILINESLIKSDSTNWGNYSNSTFTIINVNAKYSEDSGATYNFIPSKGYSKINKNILLTTGTTERNSVLGIYDLAGNVREFTLEKTTNASNPCSNRGGYYGNTGINIPASARNYTNILGNYDSGGFRTALY